MRVVIICFIRDGSWSNPFHMVSLVLGLQDF